MICEAVFCSKSADLGTALQDEKGIWNRFGGRLDWDSRAIVADDRNFGGRGGPSSGELFPAAPNVDHSQNFVKSDIIHWMQWLRDFVGYDGWRYVSSDGSPIPSH